MQKILLGLIRLYRLMLKPLLGSNCRFHPTCSAYAAEAVKTHGSVKGLGLALRRVGKCHPWNPGGFDPVPACSHSDSTREVAK